MMTMWLSLPGAAMCSIPISKWVVPQLLAGTGIPTLVPAFSDVEVLLLWLIPATAITSRKAYQHCISSTGHPGVRMALMIFNFAARTFADLCIAIFVIGSVILTVMAIFMAIFG